MELDSMGTFTIMNAVTSIAQNANLTKELGNFMTLAGAHPNMVGAHGLRTMKDPNRLALK